jgi:hypothetical protein
MADGTEGRARAANDRLRLHWDDERSLVNPALDF